MIAKILVGLVGFYLILYIVHVLGVNRWEEGYWDIFKTSVKWGTAILLILGIIAGVLFMFWDFIGPPT